MNNDELATGVGISIIALVGSFHEGLIAFILVIVILSIIWGMIFLFAKFQDSPCEHEWGNGFRSVPGRWCLFGSNADTSVWIHRCTKCGISGDCDTGFFNNECSICHHRDSTEYEHL